MRSLPRSPRRLNPQYKTVQLLRRRINVSTRFLVTPLGNGKECLTCRTCRKEIVQNVGGVSDEHLAQMSPAFVARLIKYRGHGGGIWGICPHCTEQERDARYPLKGIPRYRGG